MKMTVENTNVADIDPIAEANAAYAEMDADISGEPIKKKEDEPAQPVEEQKADDSTEPSEEPKKEESEPTEEKSEEKTDEGEAKAEPAKTEKSESDIIQEHAVKHGMTWSEAREDLEKTKKVLENYKTPEELARALRSTQSAYDKLKAQAQQEPKQEVFQPLTDEQFLSIDRQKMSANKEAIVAQYRQNYPAKAELLTDEAILEEVAEKRLVAYKVWSKEQEGVIKQKASEKREKVFESIKESDKRFIPDVKAILGKVPDSRLMSDDFDIQIFVDKVKGERYDTDVKAAEERGFKRGKEEVKILGVKTSGETKSSSTAKVTGGLNDAQKKRAIQMFSADDGYTPEQAYEAFKDVHEADLKKNPNFVF
jgi:hypothetical protein